MRLIPILLVAALSAPVAAQTLQDTAAIDAVVADFTGAAIGEPGGARSPVDRRLRLARCPAAPVAAWFGRGQASVRVDCPVPGGWTVYVPLAGGGGSTQPVVARGDLVAVQVRGEGFSLSARGEALAAGAPGAAIAVRMAGQDPRAKGVMATVIGPGKVGIELP